MTERVVIIGAGHGGFQLASSLRQLGFQGSVSLIGDETGLPYQRPPLSKDYLLGKAGVEDLVFRPDDFFVENRIERIQAGAVAIDRGARIVLLDHGDPVAYDWLVFATGARRRELSVGGTRFNGVLGLATLADANRVKLAIAEGCKRAVVVGAGFIGLEFAAVARQLGLDIAVVDAAPRAMARAVSPNMSRHFEDFHLRHGVRLLFREGVAQIVGEGCKVRALKTSSGEILPADLVVAGIGVVPNDALAADAGLEIDNGILVDEYLRTSDPQIFAIGDCARFSVTDRATRLRLESVQNATDHARLVGSFLVNGNRLSYRAVPWFWSDQGDLKLQIAGLGDGCDEFVEQIDDRGMSVYCFRKNVLQAVESVNRVGDHMAARRLLATRGHLPGLDDVRRDGFSLKEFIADRAA